MKHIITKKDDDQTVEWFGATEALRFVKSTHPADMPENEVNKMHGLAADVLRAVGKAMDAGFDVEVLRVPIPPWAMRRNQVHVRIWPKPCPKEES